VCQKLLDSGEPCTGQGEDYHAPRVFDAFLFFVDCGSHQILCTSVRAPLLGFHHQLKTCGEVKSYDSRPGYCRTPEINTPIGCLPGPTLDTWAGNLSRDEASD
jgi:hypothetical protein